MRLKHSNHVRLNVATHASLSRFERTCSARLATSHCVYEQDENRCDVPPTTFALICSFAISIDNSSLK